MTSKIKTPFKQRRKESREYDQIRKNIRKAYKRHRDYDAKQYKLYRSGKITLDEYYKRYDKSWKTFKEYGG